MALRKCPKCAEMIQSEALVCRYCGQTFTEDERNQARGNATKKQLIIGGSVVLGLLLIIGQCSSGSDTGASDNSGGQTFADSSPVTNSIQLDRFAWESSGSRYCNASAKITNTSGRDLTYVKLTTQFLKGDQLVSSEYSYTDPTDIPAGASVTWKNMYECPGAGTTVDISANSSEGILIVNDPPAKTTN